MPVPKPCKTLVLIRFSVISDSSPFFVLRAASPKPVTIPMPAPQRVAL